MTINSTKHLAYCQSCSGNRPKRASRPYCQSSTENKRTHAEIVIISDKYDALIQTFSDLDDFEWGKLISQILADAEQLWQIQISTTVVCGKNTRESNTYGYRL